VQLEEAGPFKIPIPYRFSLMDTALPSPSLFQTDDAKLATVLEKRQAEFQSVRPKVHRYAIYFIEELLQLFMSAAALTSILKILPSNLPSRWTNSFLL
jgi:hypothetical protein